MSRGTRLYLVRHAQTEWNHSGRYQGHMDVALSPEGRRQAELVGRRLQGEKVDAVYTSDLRRARETAAAVARMHGLEILQVRDLREMDFGLWEGLTYEEIRKAFPRDVEEWLADPGTKQVPGGESFAELQERACRAVREIIAQHPGQAVAVVSHGGTLSTVISSLLGLGLAGIWRFHLDNASVSIVDCYGNCNVLSLLNDISHLKDK
ncbi:alpha-ribazole phosphatase [Thermanaeromonas sp. C210]|uniref:alpha-ribazole phosphatase n=1 Tax=Thermanaeromonas sp. C210 TaxID=2731925 RepID=UPI00155BAEA3|nr:alpha-ribazole phosphatase [Thermanaeromonas sp. C210]GFN23765.1 alpha-ribazole phosphatase [Thermanaeromonas sp. C210]